MDDGKLIFGLAEHHYRAITEQFRDFPHIREELIFGSRAKDSAKPYSDIDLAVIAPEMDDQEFSQLWNRLDALDLLHWDRLDQQPLKDAVMKQGKPFYTPCNQA